MRQRKSGKTHSPRTGLRGLGKKKRRGGDEISPKRGKAESRRRDLPSRFRSKSVQTHFFSLPIFSLREVYCPLRVH